MTPEQKEQRVVDANYLNQLLNTYDFQRLIVAPLARLSKEQEQITMSSESSDSEVRLALGVLKAIRYLEEDIFQRAFIRRESVFKEIEKNQTGIRE